MSKIRNICNHIHQKCLSSTSLGQSLSEKSYKLLFHAGQERVHGPENSSGRAPDMVFNLGVGEGVQTYLQVHSRKPHTQAQKRLEPHVSKVLIIWTRNGQEHSVLASFTFTEATHVWVGMITCIQDTSVVKIQLRPYIDRKSTQRAQSTRKIIYEDFSTIHSGVVIFLRDAIEFEWR